MLLAEHGLDLEGVSIRRSSALCMWIKRISFQWKHYQGNDPLQLARVCDSVGLMFLYSRMSMWRVLQVEVFFTEVEISGLANKYVPRSVQVDLEEGVCNRVSTFPQTVCVLSPNEISRRSVLALWGSCTVRIPTLQEVAVQETTGLKDVSSVYITARYVSHEPLLVYTEGTRRTFSLHKSIVLKYFARRGADG